MLIMFQIAIPICREREEHGKQVQEKKLEVRK